MGIILNVFLKEKTECENIDWNLEAHYKVQWRAFVNAIMNIIFQKADNIETKWVVKLLNVICSVYEFMYPYIYADTLRFSLTLRMNSACNTKYSSADR
jgi:hypothetical protein